MQLEPTRPEILDPALLEENAEDLYENAPCGYFSTLPDGTFVKVNRTFLKWTGYSREGLLAGKRFSDLLTIAGKIYCETHFVPLLHMQGEVDEIAFELVRRDGGRLPVLINSSLRRDVIGTPLLIRTTVFNASERREYERELLLARRKAEAAAEAKARLLSVISHEIRNPLSAMATALVLLENTGCTPSQQRYVRVLNSASQSLLDLVNDVLDYSRLDSGKLTLEERTFSLQEVVERTIQGLQARAEQKQVALQVELDPDLPEVLLGDPVKIGQILANLAGNAVKFTDNGYVRLSVQVTDLQADSVGIDFSVQDTGIGIAPDRLETIFEEFTQASSDITLKFGGSGLGLTIVQKLLRLHGSEIQVESTLGAGSTFSFHLRLKREAVHTGAESASPGLPQ